MKKIVLTPREIEPDDVYLCCVDDHPKWNEIHKYSTIWQNPANWPRGGDNTGLDMCDRIEISQDISFHNFCKRSDCTYLAMLQTAKANNWGEEYLQKAHRAFDITVQAFLDGYSIKAINTMAKTKQNTDYGKNFVKYFEEVIKKYSSHVKL